ncbi:Oidioi.mRNA.OKI2018_I69.XSR.g13675.t1.cds [Oikopleura dioica]|uniref:Oidioi.mRNA.OKI2018_I69.XSR.g13675.t1.cds n=1 Tax=Oikopleura dioica TaxID=34765 RepID=A0ABN7S819_OIKDI|nr:Oidioi.mRNA.OKI2018_I69.XSR.g13675.t1.cds [Oikopleura dioica]
MQFKPCTEGRGGTGDLTETIGNVHSIQIEACEWTGKNNEWCGLKIGSFNSIYVEYDMANAHKLSSGPIKKYPKKGDQLNVAICGRIPGVPICAPFSLPNTNACEQGINCKRRKVKKNKLDKKRVFRVALEIQEIYPQVKVVSEWQIKDPTQPDAPPLFCFNLPLAVVP